MESMKDIAIMFLANAIYHEVITEDQAFNSLKAMDASSHGTPDELDARAKALSPIVGNLIVRYKGESE
jgi:hypothetical protein